MARVLSLDIPWANGRFVGGAFQELEEGRLIGVPRATSVDTRKNGGASLPPFPDAHHVAQLLANDGNQRESLNRLWRAFHLIREAFELSRAAIDVLLVDMPTPVPATTNPADGAQLEFGYRPVETAFGNKVWIPGAATTRPDGLIQFARFQPGVNAGLLARAVFQLAALAFNGTAVVESFPQLVLGSLAEFSLAYNLPLITRLAAHKKGNANTRSNAQSVVDAQIREFLGGIIVDWRPTDISIHARSDGYDALLGLLPGVVLHGYAPPAREPSPWQRSVVLRNLAAPAPDYPVAQGVGQSAQGCRAWILTDPQIQTGIDESGIFCLDMRLWG